MSTNRGFTLIELLLVIAIILAVGLSSAVIYSRSLTQGNVNNVSDQLMDQFKKAQLYSMMGKQNTSWGVRFVSSQVTLFATGNSAFDENFSVSSAITISGLTSVTFSKVIGIPDVTPTISISGAGSMRTLTVNSLGTISR